MYKVLLPNYTFLYNLININSRKQKVILFHFQLFNLSLLKIILN